jgi:hypothetical protein
LIFFLGWGINKESHYCNTFYKSYGGVLVDKYAIEYTPTGDLLDDEGYLSDPELKKDLMMFDDEAEAEEYMQNTLFGTNGQGLDYDIINYQG